MGRLSEETEERHVPCFFCSVLVATLCGLLVQPVQAEPVDSLAVEAESVDSLRVKVDKEDVTFGEFLNKRAVTRIPTKVVVGALTAVGVGAVLVPGAGMEGDDGIGQAVAAYVSFFLGYPLGVYLADWRESSFWPTCIGHSLGVLGAFELLDSPNPSERAERAAWVTLLGAPVLASELSRMVAVTGGPKRPKQSQDLRFSVGLVPQPHRGLSAIATLRF